MFKFDRRLRAVLDEVRCSVLADIGCDHGKIAVGALLEGRASAVLAVDVSAKSLQKTVALATEYKVSDRIRPIVGDGVLPVKDYAPDCVVIAGMGGNEIVKILHDADYPARYILVPHQDADLVRRYLVPRFAVVKDYIVASGNKFYPVIVAQKGASRYDAAALWFGRNDPPSEDYDEMIRMRKAALQPIVEGSPRVHPRLKEEWEVLKQL